MYCTVLGTMKMSRLNGRTETLALFCPILLYIYGSKGAVSVWHNLNYGLIFNLYRSEEALACFAELELWPYLYHHIGA